MARARLGIRVGQAKATLEDLNRRPPVDDDDDDDPRLDEPA